MLDVSQTGGKSFKVGRICSWKCLENPRIFSAYKSNNINIEFYFHFLYSLYRFALPINVTKAEATSSF